MRARSTALLVVAAVWVGLLGPSVEARAIESSGAPTTVLLAFADPAPSEPADPCRTGTTFKQSDWGDHEEVVVCTYDSEGNSAPTDASGNSLTWTITGSLGERRPALRFDPDPPVTETTGQSASASAGTEVIDGGVTYVNVYLLDDNGDTIDTSSVEVRAYEPLPTWIETKLSAHRSGDFITGRVESTDQRCVRRRVTLLGDRKGVATEEVGTVTTGVSGRWKVETGRRRGTYTAIVWYDARAHGTILCLAARSKEIRRG